jgi:hypothetical protein
VTATLPLLVLALLAAQDAPVQEDLQALAADAASSILKPDKAGRERLIAALRAPSRRDEPGRSVWRAIRMILDRAHDPKSRPTPEELDLLAKHIRALPVDALQARDASILGEAAREFGRANPAHDLARLLAKAYFDELVEAGADSRTLEEIGRAIGVGRGSDSRWVDRSGELVWQLRGHREAGTIEHALAAERFKKGDDFAVSYARAILALHGALKNKDLFEEASKAFADARKGCPVPEHPAAFSKALKAFVLCKRCAGEGFRDCTICKATGERTAVCGQCDGAGKLFKGVSGRTRQPVIENCSACDAKGKWQIKCTTCSGEKRVKCTGCKEPFSMPTYEQLALEEACAACDGKGTPFRAVHTPCPYCFGQGRFLIPKNEPKSRLPSQD